ncbi:hypothetical protein JRO89_XS08G0011100 [Xanthoceras sorbifolium]|uniref:Uncharacterized protein n=1 Tax=Xanthoceras sorbifolium TaxID=99658 RepID=A0ABQ8HN25_9ROSI|nr:hypothetical protein JRO89_XS08G0011100 [Xanthoceras sorbifolium]
MATSPCSDCPGTQFLPTNYSSVQSQPVIADQMTFDTPMQQLGGLIGSSSTGNMVHGGAPIWIQNYQTPQTCTCSYYWNNLSSQNMVAPTSQFQANPNEVYQYSNVNDLILPSSSNLGINTINNYESHRPQFTNSIATAASSAASVAATFNDNGTGPSQEDDPLGLLDDFQWAEGLNFDELPSLLE